MASKDYDDLLESFMNNSQKVYNEDKDIHENKLPSSYNTTSAKERAAKKKTKNTKTTSNASANSKKNKKAPVAVKEKSGAAKFFGGLGKAILALLMIIGVVGIVCVSVVIIYGYSMVNGDKVFDLDKEKFSQNQTSFIYGYDNDDNLVEITRLHGEENRIWLDMDDMTPYLAKAFIAIEDERFESHHGVDWHRVGGVIVNPKNIGQGGSTITQQLIKNLTDDNDVTFVRKFNEMMSALNLEKHYSKNQIMEAYLNTIYLSHGCYGVKTAAETYFGKDAKDLNIAECACLAAITKAPTRYDPLLNPDQINPANNISRRRWIIQKMLETGQITQAEYDEAINYKMVFTNSEDYQGSQVTTETKQENKNAINSWYTDYVIDEVMTDLQKMGYTAKKARDMIYGGGLKVYSAIDFDVQSVIDDVYINYRRMPDETVEGACVVMDYNGRILGMAGGTGAKTANRLFNRAYKAKRQPGSTIKPLSVYGPALEKSLNDKNVQIYWSTPTKDAPLMEIKGKPWPTNEGGTYSNDMITVQKGLAQSKNTISARTLEKIGPSYAYDYMINRWHISTLEVFDEDFAPMATGSLTNGVTVLEMTTAYQAFGNGGYYYEGYGYYKVEDSQGKVILEKAPEDTKEVALSANTAGVMNKLLQTVMTEGTGRTYKLSGIQCFGKTGTTTESKDRWFIGGTPEYLCGIWYGYDIPKEIHYNLSPNPCGTLWNLVMKGIYDLKGEKEDEFTIPEGVVRKEYNPYNGNLSSGSGLYGWYDENNLPSYSAYVPTTEEESSEEESSEAETTENAPATTERATENELETEEPEETTEETTKKKKKEESTTKKKEKETTADNDDGDDEDE